MLSYILSALSVARHAVALTLVAGAAATTVVAGSVDQIGNQQEHHTPPMSAAVAATTRTEPSATSEVALSVTAKTTKPETSPKPETSQRTETKTNDVEALVKDCLAKYAIAKASTTAGPAGTAASEACRRAIEATGLTSTEFWKRFFSKEEPNTEPKTEPKKPTASIEGLVTECLARYSALKDNTTGATASEACHRAIEASGLSATEFRAKFGKHRAPRTRPKPTAAPTAAELIQLTTYCLTLHAALTSTSSHDRVERTTTLCNQAIAESKLTPTQFWTKFSAAR